jgi:hypothetical protein
MKRNNNKELIEKFWKGQTSLNEEEILFKETQHEGLSNEDKAYFRFISNTRKINFNDYDDIWGNIVAHERRKKRYLFLSTGIAALLLLLVSLLIVTLKVSKQENLENQFASNRNMNYYTSLGFTNNNNPTLYINGCKSSSDYHTAIQTINPNCIQYINLTNASGKTGKRGVKNGIVEVWLKGKSDEIFSVCEGTLYFYQDGEIKSITIDDECSPNLLVDCFEKPLSEIENMKPQKIKSIKLTSDPRNCNGRMDGEFIVLESK